jgi:glycosyltransferase 2 family protein
MLWRLLPFLALSIGLALTAWFVSAATLTAIFHSFAEIGWGVLAIVAVRAIVVATNGMAWAALLAKLCNVSTRIFILLRWIREAIDVTLPVASVGGGLVSARMLTFWGVSGATATAGLVADVFLQTSAQVLFALFGAILLVKVVGSSAILPPLLLAATAALLALGGFYVVQRHKRVWAIELALAIRFARIAPQAQKRVAEFQTAIDAIWRRSGNVLIALLVHAAAWAFGTLEVLITLYLLGRPVPLEHAIILESIGTTISIAAFFVPGSWGVQEGGYILIGQMLGLPPYLSLSLSLVKRVPDFLLGLPGLVVWQGIEASRPSLRAKWDYDE